MSRLKKCIRLRVTTATCGIFRQAFRQGEHPTSGAARELLVLKQTPSPPRHHHPPPPSPLPHSTAHHAVESRPSRPQGRRRRQRRPVRPPPSSRPSPAKLRQWRAIHHRTPIPTNTALNATDPLSAPSPPPRTPTMRRSARSRTASSRSRTSRRSPRP